MVPLSSKGWLRVLCIARELIVDPKWRKLVSIPANSMIAGCRALLDGYQHV